MILIFTIRSWILEKPLKLIILSRRINRIDLLGNKMDSENKPRKISKKPYKILEAPNF